MTVSTVVDHNDYTGNGVTTSFPYTFRIFKKTDLTVSVVDLNENITVLVLDTDYTVTNAGGYNGGNVVLTAPLTNGWQISIARELEPTQETDLRNQGKFFAEVHEDAFDKLTMLIQQVASMFRLALRKPSSIANWYDALGNYIRNVHDPRDPQDAATKNYVDTLENSNYSRTLRVPEPIPQLPDAVTRANKMPAFDSAGNPIVVVPPSGSASDVLIELAKPAGGNLVGLKKTGLPNNLSTTVGAYYQTTSINAVTDYGMKPDFDPTTGVANGTNNRAALQQLMDDLASIGGNKTVIIPPGNYYFNFDGSTNPGGVGVMWGRVGAGLKNVTFLCYGASFYSGSVGRLNGIFSANYGVIIKGLRAIGFGGGALASTRERDQLFALAYNCNGVTFSECYIANSLGDCIYIGGDLDDGSVTGKFCRDISIVNCTLKERYGNGVRSYNSGSRSRLAVAVIDCVDLIIKDSIIFGEIDLEPNAIGQRLQRIRITKNVFKSGEVQPYTGTNPWYEEPLHSGTQTIRGGVLVQTKAASIIAGNNVIADNDFEYGRIKLTGGSTALQYFYVANNRFSRGIIQVGSTTGSNTNPGIQLVRNFAVAPFNGQDDDIDESGTPTTVPSVMFWVGGLITLGCFIDNICGTSASGFSYMFYSSDTLVAGDNGRNTFTGNYGVSLTSGMFNFTINDTSDEFGNIAMPSSGYAYPRISKANVNLLVTNSKPISLAVSGSLDWRNALSKYWDVSPATASLSLTTISNAPVGAEVTIRANSNTPLILAHSTNFYMKGAVNASLSDTRAMITMRQISTGVWTEISRNF